jgi:tRNA uridine 5-carbamoylmethylation protein Kti12
MKKVIRLTESQLKQMVKQMMTEEYSKEYYDREYREGPTDEDKEIMRLKKEFINIVNKLREKGFDSISDFEDLLHDQIPVDDADFFEPKQFSKFGGKIGPKSPEYRRR